MDGTLGVLVWEGVEVELFLARWDAVCHCLCALYASLGGIGIEGATATGVFELHLDNASGVVIGDDEAAEGHDAVEGQGEVHGFGGDGDILAVEEGVGIAIAVVELYLGGIGHGGVATAAVGHDDQAVGALLELEGGMSEIGHV